MNDQNGQQNEQQNGQQNDQQNDYQHSQIERMVEPDAPKMGVGSRILNLITSPSELMRNIKLYPVVLIPLLLSIAIGLISIPTQQRFTEVYLQELSHISIEMYGVDLSGWTTLQEMDVYGDVGDVAGLLDIVTLVGLAAASLFTPPLLSFLSALMLFIFSKIAKGSATLGQLFSAYMHIYVIIAIGSFVMSGLIAATGNFLDVTSLAALVMPHGNLSMPLFNILSYISIFNIWVTFLTFVAVKELNGFSNVKAGIITGIAFAVSAGLTVGTFMLTFWGWNVTASAMGL